MADVDNTGTWIYIEHIENDEGEGVRIFVPSYPNTFSESVSTSVAENQGLAKTVPTFSYTHSGPRTAQLSIPIPRDMMDSLNDNGKSNIELKDGEDFTDACIRYLQAMAYPNFNADNKEIIPPTIAVKLGEEFFCYGVINSDITVVREKPIIEGGKYAYVTVSFTMYEIVPHNADEVAGGGFKKLIERLQGVFDY